jgi:hypothetical protein
MIGVALSPLGSWRSFRRTGAITPEPVVAST